MSGIAGVFHKDGRPVEREDLQKMVTSFSHRGPEGSAIWTEGSVGFTHCMLRTTPESSDETRPLASEDGKIVLVTDSRIDNRHELIASIGMSRSSSEISDGMLILAAYEKWGEYCPERLLGDFAFALWDGRSKTVFCVRDQMGIRPIYYYNTDRVFAFASEIRALLCLPQIPKKLDRLMLAYHVARFTDNKYMTCYESIYRLPPAQAICAGSESTRKRTYWCLDPSYELSLESEMEYAEAFREHFSEAVRCRLRRIGPVGSMLSGGLDSSSIACTARQILSAEHDGSQLHTFSAVFPSLPEKDLALIDERTYMNAVLELGGFSPSFIRADRLGPIEELGDDFLQGDEPHYGYNLYILLAALRCARLKGLRVLLDGLDGDTTVSYGRFVFAELLRSGSLLALLGSSRTFALRNQIPQGRVIWQMAVKPLVPHWGLQFWRKLHGRNTASNRFTSAINPSLSEECGIEEREKLYAQRYRFRSEREAHFLSLTMPLITLAIELTAKAAASCGIEMRFPFFDIRLVRFCLSLPPIQKNQGGWSRGILRNAMCDTIPNQVQTRVQKADLRPNFQRNLATVDRTTLESILIRNRGVLEEFYDIPVLHRLLEEYLVAPDARDSSSETIFGAAILGSWLASLK